MLTKIKVWAQEHWFLILLSMAVLVIALIALRFNMRFWSLNTVGSDTYYSWVEGRRILDGKNPYERILHGSMEENQKYATYFPLFYEASALVQAMGIRHYQAWIDFFRYVFLACNLAIGMVLSVFTYSRRAWALSVLAILFWYFNRWTIAASSSVALDFIPILLIVLSLGIFVRHRTTAVLLFSFSLAFKQIGIFLAPLYLIWEYQESRSLKNVILAGLWIASIPVLSSIPFLFWNAEGFIKSVAFSATRSAATQFGADSIDVVMNLSGLLARIPFLIMLAAAYFAAGQAAVGRYGAAMLVMAIFIGFNPVLFIQYLAWLMPLLALAVSEWTRAKLENYEIQQDQEPL